MAAPITSEEYPSAAHYVEGNIFLCPGYLADLDAEAEDDREDSRRYAARAIRLARLAARVSRRPQDETGGTDWTSLLAEVAVARRCSDIRATNDMHLAVALVAHFPRTLELLASGDLPVWNARTLVERAAAAEPAVRAAVDAEVADRACLLSPARIRAAVDKVIARLDADALATRSKALARSRNVQLFPLADDQAQVYLTGPAMALASWYAALDAQARALRSAGDERTLDMLRFDLATSQAPGAAAGATPGGANSAARPVRAIIEVPLATATGASEEPGHLQGYGWLSAPTCRELLIGAELRRALVDATTGTLVDLDCTGLRPVATAEGLHQALADLARAARQPRQHPAESQHDPSAALERFVRTRDRYCDGPTQRRVPALRCDLDHEIPWPHGPTSAENLVARSRRAHALKHYGWTPVRTATSTIWTSPAGQVVTVLRHEDPPPLG